MIRPTRAVVYGVGVAVLALGAQIGLAPYAAAQWLPDRAYTEGPGIRLGDLELHPGVAVRGGYDTNVYRQPGKNGFDERPSAMLGVTPHLHLSTLQAQRRAEGEDAAGAAVVTLPPPVAFDLGVAATYFHFFADNMPSNAEVDFDTTLSVLPERKIGFDVGGSFARTTRPFTAQISDDVRRQDYASDRIRPTLMLRGQSRGGVLKGRIGFSPLLTFFEGEQFKYLNQNQYEVPVGLAWKFLPSTALLYDAAYAYNDYTREERNVGRTVPTPDSQRFQSRVGINGAITPNLGIRALVGYAMVVQVKESSPLDDHEDGVGEAALTFAWSRKDNVEAGYQRLLEVSSLSGWQQLDRGFAKASMLLGGLFQLNLEAGVAHVNYGRLLAPDGMPLGQDGETHREDIRIDGGVHGEVRVTNWLAFLADFSALATLTDFEYNRTPLDPDDPMTGVPPYPGQFKTFQIFGGVRAHY